MNMLLHGMKDTEFEIFHGDTLKNQWDVLNEMNPSKKMEFDAVVANPPFSLRWEPNDTMAEDFRFKSYGLAPKSAADFAFLLHGFHFLSQEGTMAIILPHGVLFRGNSEERIRTKLLKDNHIDTVIGLPSNLFYSTGIPVCILVLKKCKKEDDVLFINASGDENFKKGKRQNELRKKDIQRIVNTYIERPDEPVERYARRVTMEEIEKNGFNLNISRYVSTAEQEPIIDLNEVNKNLESINECIEKKAKEHNEYLKELGLKTI
jgi:type I restriction enzyme M protein